ncbi:hypothetical protein HYR54_02295 [Candidatus Acetothermia bacterium]|nr:hypothetical protein [Candidatus Acetothermia bacterium]
MATKMKRRLPNMDSWSDQKIHDFWKTHDSADYWEETEPIRVKAVSKAQRAVSVKLNEKDILRLKSLAQHMGIGHTTLIRLWIKQRLSRESKTAIRSAR